jgi:signal transduction histidine kinase/ligand-binding sensor domain-containing protein/AraC-like DNA-binding protein
MRYWAEYNSLLTAFVALSLFTANMKCPGNPLKAAELVEMTDPERRPGIHFVNYDIEQGLSHNTVFCIEQDYQGFIWFGTQEGLNRFDGYEFKTYYHDPGDSLSLPGNIVNSILEDDRDRLWVATSAGLSIYDREKDHFHNFTDLTGLQLSNTIITTVLQDRTGCFWIGTFNGGVNRYSEHDRSLLVYNNVGGNNVLTHYTVRTIFEDSEGTIWIGTRYGLNRYDPRYDEFDHFMFHPEEISGGNDIRDIYEDHQGILWLATNGGGIVKFDRNTGDYTVDDGNSKETGHLTSNAVKTILEDSNGRLWIGSLNGLFLKEPGSDYLHHYQHNSSEFGSLAAHSLRDIFEDRDGNIWLALYYGGISFYNPENSRFRNYSEQGPGKNGLSSNIVSAVVEDPEGNLWIGTEGGGLNYLNRSSGAIRHFRHKPGERGISSNFVKSMAIDKEGILWIGTIETGLDRYDPSTGNFKNYQHDPDDPTSLSDNYIRSIFIDSNNRFWVGTNGGGLNLFDRRTGSFIKIHDSPLETPIRGKNINAMTETADGRLAIGTNKGLNLFDPESGTNEYFSRYDSHENHFITEIWCLYADDGNILWIGTNEAGLFRLDLHTGLFRLYDAENYLPNNVVYGILPDEAGNLWISTNKAITKFNLSDSTVSHYDSHSGLLSNQFNYNSFYRTGAGELIFGGNKGFTVFSPGEIGTNTIPAPARLTGFKLMNKNVDLSDPVSPLSSNIIVADRAVLNHKQSVFSIEFAALCYVAPEKNQYAYTLEGFLDEWIELGNNRNVTFTNLDPGKYTFRLRVSNNDGLWNEEQATLDIHVLPPWWKTPWAWTTYAFILAGALYFLVRIYRIRFDEKNKLKYEQLEKQRIIDLNQMKLKFFTNISHEFKTPLSLIIGPLEELKDRFSREGTDPEAGKTLSLVHKNSLMLNSLIEQLMTFRKIEAGAKKLKIKKVDVVSYLKRINESFLEMAGRMNIRFTFSHDLIPVYLWFDPEMMERVFFNILSNAFKHTPAGGTIDVSVHQERPDDPVEIKITDSGPGIPEDSLEKIFERFYQLDREPSDTVQGTGIGLSFARDIVQLHRGTISAENVPGKGACFTLRLYTGTDHLVEHQVSPAPKAGVGISEYILDEEEFFTPDPGTQVSSKKPNDLPTLLIVEDNESLRQYLAESLSDSFSTHTAADGKKGLFLTRKYSPDLIITDVMMPEMGGVEMTERIKSDFDTCHIPVIMLTAKSSIIDQIEGITHGADAYFAKPFSMKLLRAQIGSLLENREKLRKAFGSKLKPTPSTLNIQSMDEKFLVRAIAIVEKSMEDPAFGVKELGEEIGMSRMQLNRKFRGILNQTPSEFIRTIRLKRAAQLMVDGNLNVSEVIYHVGISSRTYFTKAFSEQFGMSPKAFVKESTEKAS